jgi:hypothetical protein
MRALLDLDAATPGEGFDDFLFHYTSAEKLASILDGGEFWLTAYSRTNDPREKTEWLPRVVRDGIGIDLQHDFSVERREADRLLRTGARLGCHTIDRVPGSTNEGLFHRGWARARMWDQYSDHHRGACLVFDKAALNMAIDRDRRMGDDDMMTWGPVRYVDAPMRFDLALEDVERDGLDIAIGDAQSRDPWLNELYFTKNCDWASESEYRQVVVLWNVEEEQQDAPIRARFGPSLLAVIVGEHFPSTELSVLRHRAHCSSSLVLAQCVWELGAPQLRGLPDDG